MKITYKKILLIFISCALVQLFQLHFNGQACAINKFFTKKSTESQPALQNNVEEDTSSITDSQEQSLDEITTIYPAVIDSTNQQKNSVFNKINIFNSRKNKAISKKSQETDVLEQEFDESIEGEPSAVLNNEDNLQEKPAKKSHLINKFHKNKKQKGDSEEKVPDKKHSLTKIQNIIENEPYLNHDSANDIYLDKYKRKELSTLKDFYRDKEIIESKDGSLNLVVKDEDRTIDKLIDEIENVNSDGAFTPPIQLTMKECIGIALAKRPDILSARLSADMYKDRVTQAWAAYFPSFSAGVNYNRSRNKIDDYAYRSKHHYLPTLSAGLLLFDFGKTKTNVDIAKTDYAAMTYDLESSINDVIYVVKDGYYNLLFAQKQIDVYQNTIEDFELQLKVAKKYFEIGKKPQIDVTIAEYNLGNAKLNLVKAKNTLEVARVSLANTMGLPKFANFELAEPLPTQEYDADLETLLQDAFTIRPDLLSQEKAVEAAYLGIRSAKRNFLPDLMASGSYAKGKTDKTDESNFQVGLDLSYSGLNLMQIKKEHDIAKKAYEKALADYERSKQKVHLEVKQAYINLNSSKNTVKQAELNVEQAKAQNYHATGRYNAGYGDAIELKDAENTYLSAQLEYYQALLDYNSEAANIERLVGRPLVSTETDL